MKYFWLQEVKERVKGIPISGGRSKKWGKISFDDLVFLPAQLFKRPVDYYRQEINSQTIIGKKSKKPIRLKTPIIIAGMSFGALSREAKIALARASQLAGTIANTGEGGMLEEERKEAKNLILQYSTARFGVTDKVLKKANAVEIKIAQGAKPGSGGVLPKEKVTGEIAGLRKVPLGRDIHSPASHPDIKNGKDLKKKVVWLRKVTGGVPIIIKLAGGDIENDLKLAVGADPDIVAIDGMEGGTGAAPKVLLDEVGIPTLASLVRAREILDKLKAPQELWIGGGLQKGGDIAKALALGAQGVFLGFSLLVAMGCQYCQKCYLGRCPQGIATQNPELRKNLNIKEASQRIANFINTLTEEVKIITGAVGKKDVHELSREDLRALNLEVSQITKIPLV